MDKVVIQQSSAKFSDIIDTSCPDNAMLVSAAGGLMRYIENHRAVSQLGESNSNVTVHKMEHFNLDQYLHINPTTLKALQIFNSESHPSRSLAVSGREGFSVFGYLQESIATKAGSAMLREWFLKPVRDLDIIQERLDVIELLQAPRFAEYVVFLRKKLRQVKDLRNVYYHFRTATATVGDWLKLISSLRAILKLIELVTMMSSNIDSDRLPPMLQSLIASEPMEHITRLQKVRSVFCFLMHTSKRSHTRSF